MTTAQLAINPAMPATGQALNTEDGLSPEQREFIRAKVESLGGYGAAIRVYAKPQFAVDKYAQDCATRIYGASNAMAPATTPITGEPASMTSFSKGKPAKQKNHKTKGP